MLLTFRVKNFKSFGDKLQTFSLVAGKEEKHKDHLAKAGKIDLLKFAAMYGSNASGKSNFIKSLDFFRKSIQKENDVQNSVNFSNKMLNAKEDSYFELELSVNDGLFSYGFEINFKKRKIISEWLIDYTEKKEGRAIFERSQGNIKSEIDFQEDRETESMFEVFKKEYEGNTSNYFIKYIAQKEIISSLKIKDIKNINKVYDAITKNMHITYPNKDVRNYQPLIIEKKEELEEILIKFSTGILKIHFNEISKKEFNLKITKNIFIKESIEMAIERIISISEKNIKSQNLKHKNTAIFSIDNKLFFVSYDTSKKDKCVYNEISFIHNKNDVFFNYGEESDGTKRLIQLLSIFLDNTKDKTFFIDEIDRSLHPLLTQKFIELFFKLKKEHKQQLVITTHESRLLNFNLIRQDEIWFAEKNDLGYSELFSLEDFGERNDRKLDKAYLDGRYRAIPIFAKDFFEN